VAASQVQNIIQAITPSSLSGSIIDVQAGSKTPGRISRCRDALGEDIGIQGCRRYKEYVDMIERNMNSNKLQVNLHMLGTLVLNRIVGEVDGTYVVTINYNAWHGEECVLPLRVKKTIISAGNKDS